MDAAYWIMCDWPAGAGRLFSALADRNPIPATDHPLQRMFATKMGYHLLGALRSMGSDRIEIIDEALKVWLLTERGIYVDGRRRAQAEDAGQLTIDVVDAMRRLEGRELLNRGSIKSWEEAGAVVVVDKKVLLSSVLETVEALEHCCRMTRRWCCQ